MSIEDAARAASVVAVRTGQSWLPIWARGPGGALADAVQALAEAGDGHEVVADVAALADKARELLVSPAAFPARSGTAHGPPVPGSPNPIERILAVRALLRDGLSRLECFVADLAPIRADCSAYDPSRDYRCGDSKEVMLALVAESERLARMARHLIDAESHPTPAGQGLAMVALALLAQVLGDVDAQFELARLATTGPNS